MVTLPSSLVTATWLAQHLGSVMVLDASWHMPATKRDAKAEFEQAHIPSARFFDIDANSATDTHLPHMLSTAEAFTAAIGQLGIANDDAVVAYDTQGLFSAARLWWMFRVFGHANVAVLDGGLPAWQAAGHATESGQPRAAHPSVFNATFQRALVRDCAEVKTALTKPDIQVIDARSRARFSGEEKDPRPGIRSGHIPGSANLHYAACLNADGTMKNADELRRLLRQAGATPDKTVISSCGSGVTACILDLALTLTNHPSHAVYDGSWAEWGQRGDCPVETA